MSLCTHLCIYGLRNSSATSRTLCLVSPNIGLLCLWVTAHNRMGRIINEALCYFPITRQWYVTSYQIITNKVCCSAVLCLIHSVSLCSCMSFSCKNPKGSWGLLNVRAYAVTDFCFSLWRFAPIPGHGLFLRVCAITRIVHTTIGRTSLDEWSARRRDL